MNITLKKEYHSESNGGILSILGKIGKKKHIIWYLSIQKDDGTKMWL